ncbi:S8 family serine peptidase [Bacillus sp. AR18-7]|uniref:S8 family peptidase n=1 Tax=Bacillus sp. AR18-7 TaxID=2217821 RepID=UPI0015D453D9|nr:S8 family serine peptidase [Bacillus sp. AR18-7]
MPDNNSEEVSINSEKRHYMIGPLHKLALQNAGLSPLSQNDMDLFVKEFLENMGIKEVDRIHPSNKTLMAMEAGVNDATDTIVVEMDPKNLEFIKKTMPPQLIITEDKPLGYNKIEQDLIHLTPFSVIQDPKKRKFRFLVIGQDNKPLSKVSVCVVGEWAPAYGITDENGKVEIESIMFNASTPRLLTLTAPHSYWDIFSSNPTIHEEIENTIKMSSLAETITGFPEQFHFGWGQRLMGLDKMPQDIDGAGVKIAIIDSGCDNSHPLLQHVRIGRDFTSSPDGQNPDQNTWTKDTIGHGTHCTGIITAQSSDGSMMHGFAPKAEIHSLRIFSEENNNRGFSYLKKAIEYCIEHEIDIISMSLGAQSAPDPQVEQTLETAMQNGIICIAAAGNSSKAVQYPASSSYTLAVSAVGSNKDLHSNTWDSTNIQEGLIADDGIFSPKFTCFGPEVDVCAPGVSIISTVPGGMFKPESGTSMATPHVTGLAALLLAHHPLFQSEFQARDRKRVETLFGLIRSQCKPYSFGNSLVGAGLPILGPVNSPS